MAERLLLWARRNREGALGLLLGLGLAVSGGGGLWARNAWIESRDRSVKARELEHLLAMASREASTSRTKRRTGIPPAAVAVPAPARAPAPAPASAPAPAPVVRRTAEGVLPGKALKLDAEKPAPAATVARVPEKPVPQQRGRKPQGASGQTEEKTEDHPAMPGQMSSSFQAQQGASGGQPPGRKKVEPKIGAAKAALSPRQNRALPNKDKDLAAAPASEALEQDRADDVVEPASTDDTVEGLASQDNAIPQPDEGQADGVSGMPAGQRSHPVERLERQPGGTDAGELSIDATTAPKKRAQAGDETNQSLPDVTPAAPAPPSGPAEAQAAASTGSTVPGAGKPSPQASPEPQTGALSGPGPEAGSAATRSSPRQDAGDLAPAAHATPAQAAPPPAHQTVVGPNDPAPELRADRQTARKLYEMVLEVDQSNKQARASLASLLLDEAHDRKAQGDLSAVASLITSAVRLDPDQRSAAAGLQP